LFWFWIKIIKENLFGYNKLQFHLLFLVVWHVCWSWYSNDLEICSFENIYFLKNEKIHHLNNFLCPFIFKWHTKKILSEQWNIWKKMLSLIHWIPCNHINIVNVFLL
jgi:hypothetical protein